MKFNYVFIVSILFGIEFFTLNTSIAQNHLLNPVRFPFPSDLSQLKYEDLDKDGDPDLLYYTIYDTIPVLWIDDDDDMKPTDVEGDMDSDCLIIDFNNDDIWGGPHDIIVDWNDEDGDNVADMQVFIEQEYSDEHGTGSGRPHGHYMWVVDTDNDRIFNYINWKNFELKAWDRYGMANFFEDYHGKSLFMKTHVSTFNISDLSFNWENPFLFYDPDNDGLTEYTIRFAEDNVSKANQYDIPPDGVFNLSERTFTYDGSVTWGAISFDIDNDNTPSNEFDFDFTIHFRGGGFQYSDREKKRYASLKGLPGSDTLFYDSRYRQLDFLVYASHEEAADLLFNRGKWEKVYFIFDEDDDCHRWERVELYEPLDPFIIEPGAGGISNPSQSDITGDRAEWDLDNSGSGKLYFSPLDGKLHLYGAEWGVWRIDQNARYYQGWGGWQWKGMEYPDIFPTIKYTDNNSNGFMDKIEMDLDGDTIFEISFDALAHNISDESSLIDISQKSYVELQGIFKEQVDKNWKNALTGIDILMSNGLNTEWYAFYLNPKSLNQKRDYSYWINLYVFMDLTRFYQLKKDEAAQIKVLKAFFQNVWSGAEDEL